MKESEIPFERLLRQRVAGQGLKNPGDVVRWLGAVQAQDYPGAKWAVGLRTEGRTDAQIEAAFDAGEILRVHVLRPTWHFLAPEDLRWMQALTAARVKKTMGTQFRAFGLDAALLHRCNRVLEKTLRDGRQLTRANLSTALERAGIPATGLRLADIVMNAELDAVICSGARRGKQFTYALAGERAPEQKILSRDESLALLTERFFTSHGPATAKDFAWWSGMLIADGMRGLDLVKSRLVCENIHGQSYWMGPSAPAARPRREILHLLPNYDEYLSGHADRSAIMDSRYMPELDSRQNPLFNHPIISSGRVAGTWKRTVGSESLSIEAKWLRQPTKAELRQLEQAKKRMARFYRAKLEKG